MIDTSEKNFETAIEQSLINNGYRSLNSKSYNRSLCLIPEDVINFIQATQGKEWQKFKAQYNNDAKEILLKRLCDTIKKRGTLELLRKELKVNGCRFKLAYFQPESTLNEETHKLYQANFFTVIRQLHFSEKNEQSLDLVLFLNGLPIFTAELKNPLKGQNVESAIKQYKQDREPREPLFKFGVCLAHFAVDPELVYMTTHLQGINTKFLPFNQGRNGGAGNPDSAFDFATSYLWQNVWQKNSVLDLLQNFIIQIEEEDDKGKSTGKEKLIFPRYHQLDTVRRIVSDACNKGVGESYLVQHSAGSGKSNSIAWLAHRLAGLHDSSNDRIFDSIIVITDRRLLDRQLQKTIKQFQQTTGVVENIDKTSKQLKEALEGGKNIIVTTLQKFPVIVDQIQSLRGQNFAVIIDEAHSSQSGESSKKLKSVLSTNSLEVAEAEEIDNEDETLEDRIVLEAKQRGKIPNLSYFAFTATPKNKTLEIFGTKQSDGSFKPFSLYSMRQAIEEGFILDVLANYTTYKTYFNLLKTIENDPQYDSQKASFLLRNFVELHEHAINQKIAIIVEHFHTNIAQQINGKAKAMIVTRSRLHAVRYKLALDKYLKDKYPYKSLVAFTGTVNDGQEYTETGMNTASTGQYISDAKTAETFRQEEYRFLVVANKFQTGFDEPLLVAMYVDKKLQGVNAVQTLSRLNRTYYPLKISTMILDFVNEISEIQEAFQAYYDRVELTEGTDINQLYDLEAKLEDYDFYTNNEVEAFAKVYFNTKATQDRLYAILAPIVDKIKEVEEEERRNFRKLLQEFIKLYGFVSQLLPIPDKELEKFYQFARHLIRKIPVNKDTLPLDVQENIELEQYRIQQTYQGKIELEKGQAELNPVVISEEEKTRQKELEALSEIIEEINKKFGTDFSEKDRVFIEQLELDLDKSESLKYSFIVNTTENAKITFNEVVKDFMEDTIDSNFNFYQQYNKDIEFKSLLLDFLFERFKKRVSCCAFKQL
ncbi:type I restriction endonuclease subunit R [Gloeocapsa sp. PCC 73106]|uniref:type I restriction endonuclease subunit R n=1 Tax=Gloeocapsa sp. PCC 73106 TaxID=102232 RepID=UPI0002ACE74B|nr:type I restriction endonuclease [Gloeocapsa sp. PCC 73106]ELR96866.1 helicase, type I site-specific restriction-modification system restriction subunit [Gloeocapsa sp. PCC 73106]